MDDGFTENDVLQKRLNVLPFRIPRVFFNGPTTMLYVARATYLHYVLSSNLMIQSDFYITVYQFNKKL